MNVFINFIIISIVYCLCFSNWNVLLSVAVDQHQQEEQHHHQKNPKKQLTTNKGEHNQTLIKIIDNIETNQSNINNLLFNNRKVLIGCQHQKSSQQQQHQQKGIMSSTTVVNPPPIINNNQQQQQQNHIHNINNNNNHHIKNSRLIKIDDIQLFSNENCKIKNPQRVQQILNELILGGSQKLQIVSDFDFTITKQRCANGKKAMSSFGVFDACETVPLSYKTESATLFAKYHPIEIDPMIPESEKIIKMIEWWTAMSEIMTGFPFDEAELDRVTKNLTDTFRDGVEKLFHELNTHNIPMLLFSAGLGNCIESLLKQSEIMLPNVKIVSNFLRYKDGLLNGFDLVNMVHVFNKNENTLFKDSDYYKKRIHDRDHIILMGDSLGDANMAVGMPTTSHILKIGFLIHHIEQNLPKYMETFDIVLLDDQTMDVPRAILSLITELNGN